MPKIRQPSAEERELCQRVFLNQVNGLLPVVLEELRSHVLPTLDAANHALYAAALDNWCERWGMGDEWVRRFAIDTLKYWQVTEVPEGERLSWRFPDAVPNPIVPSRRGKRRARNELDDFTFRWQETEDGSFLPQAELERFARWRRKRGLDDPKRARRHRPTSESEHFQWLAIYHLASRLPGAEHRGKRLTQQTLADAIGIECRGLRDALRKAATLIGFTPRRLQRPRKPQGRRRSNRPPKFRKASK